MKRISIIFCVLAFLVVSFALCPTALAYPNPFQQNAFDTKTAIPPPADATVVDLSGSNGSPIVCASFSIESPANVNNQGTDVAAFSYSTNEMYINSKRTADGSFTERASEANTGRFAGNIIDQRGVSSFCSTETGMAMTTTWFDGNGSGTARLSTYPTTASTDENPFNLTNGATCRGSTNVENSGVAVAAENGTEDAAFRRASCSLKNDV